MSEVRIRKMRNSMNRRLTVVDNSLSKSRKPYTRNTDSFLDPARFETKLLSDHKKHKPRGSMHPYKLNSLFNDSPSKNSLVSLQIPKPLDSPIKFKIIKSGDQKIQIESLDSLLKKCNDIQEDSKTSRVLIGYNKVNSSMRKLRRSIEKYQEDIVEKASQETAEKSLRVDAKILRLQLNLEADKLVIRHKKIWKFSTPSITKKTQKLIEFVDKEFGSRKILQKSN